MASELFELAAAIARTQVRAALAFPTVYDNSTCCQRCGRQVRLVSTVPATAEELLNTICVLCASGDAA